MFYVRGIGRKSGKVYVKYMYSKGWAKRMAFLGSRCSCGINGRQRIICFAGGWEIRCQTGVVVYNNGVDGVGTFSRFQSFSYFLYNQSGDLRYHELHSTFHHQDHEAPQIVAYFRAVSEFR